MTTPEPRVRVEMSEMGYWGGRPQWKYAVRCSEHGWQGRSQLWSRALVADAHRHAATCPALRLARLLRELEALRDGLRTTVDEDWYSSDPAMLRAFNIGRSLARSDAAADLTALIDRATDGRTGC